MNTFIARCSVFLLILIFAFLSIYFFNKPAIYANDYMAAIIDKHRRIEKITSPRIILVGGSNVAFGLDSRMIEESLGTPVVNLGLSAGLGLNFILNEVKKSLRPNDIVILSFEYFLSLEGSYALKKLTSDFYPAASNYYFRNYFTELDLFFEKHQHLFKSIFLTTSSPSELELVGEEQNSIYRRLSFNSYGDAIGHLDKPRKETLNDKNIFRYQFWNGIEEINRFAASVKEKNVCIFFCYPGYPESEYEKNKEVLNLLNTDIQKNIIVEILNSPKDMVFPDSCFFDTIYHLNKGGRNSRTQRIIDLIQKNDYARNCLKPGQSKK